MMTNVKVGGSYQNDVCKTHNLNPRILLRYVANYGEQVNTKVLFPNSCKKITSLVIQSNQLQFYTATGQKQSIELPSEQIEKIIGALKATQAEAGVALRSKGAKSLVGR